MAENEIFVIASKVKAYIKTSADMKCSAAVINVLSERVKEMCDKAVEKAKPERRRRFKKGTFSP